jgi:hypothetical protein
VNPGPCLFVQRTTAAAAAAATAGHHQQHISRQRVLLHSSLFAVSQVHSCKLRAPQPPAAAASTAAAGGGADDPGSSALALPSSLAAAPEEPTYTLKDTTVSEHPPSWSGPPAASLLPLLLRGFARGQQLHLTHCMVPTAPHSRVCAPLPSPPAHRYLWKQLCWQLCLAWPTSWPRS